MQKAALIPELIVSDLSRSLSFYCELLGFQILYDRVEDGFASLIRGEAEIMLEGLSESRSFWLTAALEMPFGRGINFQIAVDNAQALAARVAQAGHPFFKDLHEARYRTGTGTISQRQFIIQDPDGYLLRFAERISI